MSSEILVAVLSLFGTAIGSIAGVLTANKLVIYRIEQLEKKVEKHNSVIERTYKNETDIQTAFARIDDLRAEVYHAS